MPLMTPPETRTYFILSRTRDESSRWSKKFVFVAYLFHQLGLQVKHLATGAGSSVITNFAQFRSVEKAIGVTVDHQTLSPATTSTISVSSLPRAWNIDRRRKVLSPLLVSVSPRPRKVMDALMKIFLFSMRKISSILFLPVTVCWFLSGWRTFTKTRSLTSQTVCQWLSSRDLWLSRVPVENWRKVCVTLTWRSKRLETRRLNWLFGMEEGNMSPVCAPWEVSSWIWSMEWQRLPPI